MTERIRVKDKDTGYHRTIPASAFAHGNYERLKSAAVDPVTGDDVPPKFDAAHNGEPATGRQAETPKEND